MPSTNCDIDTYVLNAKHGWIKENKIREILLLSIIYKRNVAFIKSD